jgi:hypothetical protein
LRTSETKRSAIKTAHDRRVAAVSGVLGVILGLPLLLREGSLISAMSFMAVALSVSPVAVAAWIAVTVLGAVVATLVPVLQIASGQIPAI